MHHRHPVYTQAAVTLTQHLQQHPLVYQSTTIAPALLWLQRPLSTVLDRRNRHCLKPIQVPIAVVSTGYMQYQTSLDDTVPAPGR